MKRAREEEEEEEKSSSSDEEDGYTSLSDTSLSDYDIDDALRLCIERDDIEKALEAAQDIGIRYLKRIIGNLHLSLPMADAFITRFGVTLSAETLSHFYEVEQAWSSGFIQRCIDLKHQKGRYLENVQGEDLVEYYLSNKQDKSVLLSRIKLLLDDEINDNNTGDFTKALIRSVEPSEAIEVFQRLQMCPKFAYIFSNEWIPLRKFIDVCETEGIPFQERFVESGYMTRRTQDALPELFRLEIPIETKIWWLKRLVNALVNVKATIPDCAILFYILIGAKEDSPEEREQFLFKMLRECKSFLLDNPVNLDLLKLWWMHVEGVESLVDFSIQRIYLHPIRMCYVVPHSTALLWLLIEKGFDRNMLVFKSFTTYAHSVTRLRESNPVGPEEKEARRLYEIRNEQNKILVDEFMLQTNPKELQLASTHPEYDYIKQATIPRKVISRMLERIVLKNVDPVIKDKLPPELWSHIGTFIADTDCSSPIKTTLDTFLKYLKRI